MGQKSINAIKEGCVCHARPCCLQFTVIKLTATIQDYTGRLKRSGLDPLAKINMHLNLNNI